MAEWTGSDTTQNVLEAARRWKEQCLLGEGSMFAGEALWTRDNFQHLKELYVDNPIEGDQSFLEKLRAQLGGAPRELVQLAAESLWLLDLFVSSNTMRPDRKRERFQEVWRLSNSEPPQSEFFSDAALSGLASTGPAFITLAWRELRYFILLMLAWKTLPSERQRELMSPEDPWQFCQWVTSLEDGNVRAFRHMILYFCYPRFFERICSRAHKKTIYAAFGSKLSGKGDPYAADQSPCSLDRALLAIRQQLEAEYGTRELDFYREPLRGEWYHEAEEGDEGGPGPANTSRIWVEKTIVAGRTDREEGPYALGKALWSPQKAKGGQDIYRFMREVEPGDRVLHLTDNQAFTGVSTVAERVSDFGGIAGSEWGEGLSYRVSLRDFVRLEPPLSREVFFGQPFGSRLVGLIDAGVKNLFYNREPNLNQGAYLTPAPPELIRILDDAYMKLAGKHLPFSQAGIPARPKPAPVQSENNTIEALFTFLDGRGLFFSEELIADYLLALTTKKFVILSGLSGTGKSQLAIAVAEFFAAQHIGTTTQQSEIVEVQPYMFQNDQMSVPARLRAKMSLPPPDQGTAGGGTLEVRYPKGTDTLAFWRDPDRNNSTLYFKGPFKEWFHATLSPGAQLIMTAVPNGKWDALQISFRSHWNDNNEVVPVRPDWTDSRGFLGYYNPLSKQYMPGSAFDLLLRAHEEMVRAKNEDRPPDPYFLILDEMNLAHVEQYFAEFLSCLESGKPLDLHRDVALELKDENNKTVPRKLEIPGNLFITGTVNVDETTYMFIPKVLDRAFTIELQTVDLKLFGARKQPLAASEKFLRLTNIPMFGSPKAPGKAEWDSFGLIQNGILRDTLVLLNDRLAAFSLHFGYRVAAEIAGFVCLAARHTDALPDSLWAALDLAILAKVLPKFHGTQEELDDPLRTLFVFAVDPRASAEPLPLWAELKNGWHLTDHIVKSKVGAMESRLPRTATKVWFMLQRLHRQGFTSYIG